MQSGKSGWRRWLNARSLLLLAVVAVGVLVLAFFESRSGRHSGVPLRQYVATMEVEPGTAGMIAAIREIEDYQRGSRLRQLYKDLKARFGRQPDVATEAGFRQRMIAAERVLRTGDTERTLGLIEELERAGATLEKSPELARQLADLKAISYLRLGEQQNCLNNPHPSICIIPVDPEAVHKLREGSTKAAAILEDVLLKSDPQDYQSKWLLNIAHMTLGTYPDDVPEEHRIPMPGLYEDYKGPTFGNVADIAGVDDITLAGSVVLEDFNDDGLIDVFSTDWSMSGRVKLYLRAQDGSFADATEAAGLAGLPGGLNAIHADYDNDGDADIYLMRGAWGGKRGHIPNSLLRNNGDGTFSDVTVGAGVLDFFPTVASAFADLNNDGWLDLVVTNEVFDGKVGPDGVEFQLYLSNRDGTFVDRAAETGFDTACGGKGVAVADFDNDGAQDIFVSCLREPNLMFRNLLAESGELSFEEISEQAGVRDFEPSFATWAWDFDHDGDQDLFVAGYSFGESGGGMGGSAKSTAIMARYYAGERIDQSHPKLFRNDGNGTFTDVTVEFGLDRPAFVMGANFGDFDNDGWLDIYLGTGAPRFQSIYPNVALHNVDGQRFRDISSSSGLGHIQKGHGIGFADMDNDGDEDIFAQMGGAFDGDAFQNALFENAGNSNAWVALILQGTRSNRSAIGARIMVEVRDRSGRLRTLHRTIGGSGSFGSSSLRSEIGLGQATGIERVTVRWPATGEVETFSGLASNAAYRLVEGSGKGKALSLTPLSLRQRGTAPSRHDHAQAH